MKAINAMRKKKSRRNISMKASGLLSDSWRKKAAHRLLKLKINEKLT